MNTETLATYLEKNPRMLGVLFMMMLLLSQAGNAAAGVTYTYGGP